MRLAYTGLLSCGRGRLSKARWTWKSLVDTAGTENIRTIDSVASPQGPPKRMPSGGSRELRLQVHAVPSGNEARTITL